ncbi:hypothetical protein OG389_03065 [Streptomyces sp. NBC_00435]|uniref:hypothetical protein n=1 Tax=Streptomyces sp. NBC_00435 TaxID=2903649 RepID=UPI002E1D4B4C
MSGLHARPALLRSALETAASAHAAKHGRRGGFVRRLRRRILAYRDIEFLSADIPDIPGIAEDAGAGAGPREECLLLVHIRKVVGQVRYRACAGCGRGVITGVDITEPFRSSGLDIRALSHLRSRHPGITWRSTLTRRTTRGLLLRMRVPAATADTGCAHTSAPPAKAAGAAAGGGDAPGRYRPDGRR